MEVSIDPFNRKPILGACEHDPLSVTQLMEALFEGELLISDPSIFGLYDRQSDRHCMKAMEM